MRTTVISDCQVFTFMCAASGKFTRALHLCSLSCVERAHGLTSGMSHARAAVLIVAFKNSKI